VEYECAFVACAAWLLAGELALAASTAPPVDLVWVAPRQCPDHDTVIRDISNILGNPSPERVGKPFSVRAEVWRGEDTRWHVTLTSQGTRAEPRSLAADSCEAVADAAALIVALLVDPSRARAQGAAPPPANTVGPPTSPADAVSPPASGIPAMRATTPPSADMTAPPSADVPSRSTTASSADVPSGAQAPAVAAGLASPGASADAGPLAVPVPADRSIGTQPATRHWTVGVSGGGSVGALPSAQPDAELAIGWTNERFRLEVAGRSDLSHQHVPLASRTDEGADFRLLSGLARGCYSLVSSRLSLGGCAAFEVDWLRASGFGAVTTVSGDAAIPALGASALATYAMGDRIGIRVLLEGVAPLSRPSFVIVAPGAVAVVDRPGAIWGRAMLGAEVHFF
jgi:hypothetical protein